MDKDLINKLILVGVIAGAILFLYYQISPYQNCMSVAEDTYRNINNLRTEQRALEFRCSEETSW